RTGAPDPHVRVYTESLPRRSELAERAARTTGLTAGGPATEIIARGRVQRMDERDMTTGQRNVTSSSYDQYRQLVELSPDGILVHTAGVIVYANPVATRLLGASGADEVEGHSVLEFVHPESRGRVLGQLQRLREGKSVPFVEERFVRVDGTAVDVEVAGA